MDDVPVPLELRYDWLLFEDQVPVLPLRYACVLLEIEVPVLPPRPSIRVHVGGAVDDLHGIAAS